MDNTRKCCVRACPAKKVPGLTYFSFPVDIKERHQWLQAIGRPDIKPAALDSKHVVCSIHFEPGQMGVHREVLPDTIPTKNLPRIRKGVLITASTTASQTDLSSSDDDDDSDDDSDDSDDAEVPDTNKRIFEDEKVTIYKRLKPNRQIYELSQIQCSDDIDIRPNDANAIPMQMFVESCNLPRDSIYLSNRKIFVFSEDENFTKKNSESVKVPVNLDPLIEVPINFPVNSNLTVNTSKVIGDTVSNNDAKENNDANTEFVISDVVSLSEINNETVNKFIEWKDRTNSRRKGRKFEKDFKMFALNLHTINTRAYKILMDAWKLPKENELKDIQLRITTKLDDQMIRLLSQKFATLSKEAKYCTLGVYAKTLKPHFYYDTANDEIIGIQNVNGATCKMAANYVLVAMVRGIQVAWHQPVAFSFVTAKDVDSIDVFIRNLCLVLKEMGLKVVGMILPDDPCFWKYCRTKQFVTPTKHYISTEDLNERISLIIDIPHILNRLKNDFIKKDFVFDCNTISFKYVEQVYNVDKEKGGRLLPKLTDKHMKTDEKEKDLEIPCEVFSRAVASAIHFYSENDLLPKEAAATAEFIKKFSDVFDVLNRKKLGKLPNSKSAEVQPILHVKANSKALDEANSLFKKLKIRDSDANTEDTLKYFLISLKSLIAISWNLKKCDQKGIARTRYCNLEPMLEFLKEIDDDAKTCKPSPIQFTRAFSKLFLKYLIDLTPCPKSIGNMADFLKMADEVKDSSEYNGDRIRLKDTDYRFTLPEQYAIIYVASYLVYKCSKNHGCEQFKLYLKGLPDLNKTKIYVNFEAYNKEAAFYNELKLPAFQFVSYVEKLDEQFLKDFDRVYHVCPAESIFYSLLTVPQTHRPCECFPVEYMMKLFVRTRIYQSMVLNTERLKDRLPSDPPYVLDVQNLK